MTVTDRPTARPVRRLGAAAPGGLGLPAAAATDSQLYAPRGVWTDGQRVVAADTGNHRVLIWHTWPEADGAPADVVLGQPTRTSEGPAAAGRGPRNGMYLPTGVSVVASRLVVADAWHHRLLVWDDLPERDDTPPSSVLGQPDLERVDPNAGAGPDATSLYWPFGIALGDGLFWVADTGNRRVLGWRTAGSVPETGRPADVVLGQATPRDRAENRGAPVGPRSFRWPHALAGTPDLLVVADAGNHRVLGWSPPPAGDTDATLVLGQPDASSAHELAHLPQGPARLRFPYGVDHDQGLLAVADTANNRVLLWDTVPAAGVGRTADAVIGQPDFDAHGENRWAAVEDDTLCWPYGLSLASDRLAIADSGNNRVMLWEVS